MKKQNRIVFLSSEALAAHQAQFPDIFDRNSIELAFTIRALAQKLNEFANEWLSGVGLNASKYNYLSSLYFSKEKSLTLNELSRIIHTSNPAVTSMVAVLVADGFIEKYPNAEDRRSYRVRLTRKGERTIASAVPVHCAAINRGFERTSPAERAELLRLLHLVNDGFTDAFGN